MKCEIFLSEGNQSINKSSADFSEWLGLDDTVPQTDGLLRTPLKQPDPEQGESADEEKEEDASSCDSVGSQIAQFSVSLLFANSSRAHAVFGTKPKKAKIGTVKEIKR